MAAGDSSSPGLNELRPSTPPSKNGCTKETDSDIDAIHPDRDSAAPESVPSDDGIDDSNTHISFRQVERVDVKVRDLTITVKLGNGPWWWPFGVHFGSSSHKNRGRSRVTIEDEEGIGATPEEQDTLKILNSVSADMPAGQLVCILGSSGSGKTSLLNAMAHRMRGQNLTISGTTTFNESASLFDVRNAYVMQQDVLLPRLTVRETLRYAAELRLPANTTKVEREQIVEEVILQLGLKECANTPIGDNQHKGCSGGEKRRVSIGVQLLVNPSVVFLDEPTTGLDATSAHQLARTLKNLAMKGRTVITTLHQPRSEIWGLFDRIIILAKGHAVYSGKTSKVMGYFERLGYPFPGHVNPADYLIDLAAIDFRSPESEKASITRVNTLIAAWRDHEKNQLSLVPTHSTERLAPVMSAPSGSDDHQVAVTAATKTPVLRQLSVLTRRSFRTTYRDPMGVSGTMFLALGMSIICGWIFYQLEGSVPGIRSRMAALYISSSMHAYLMLLFETYRLCNGDIQLFDREHGEGVVSVFAFMISRRIAKLFTEDFIVPFLFSVIYYFMVGLEDDPKKFFIFFSVVMLTHYINVSFATMSVSISRDFSIAVLIGNLFYTIQSMACGFFIQASTMPVYVRWTKYICFIWYAFGAVSSNEFTDAFYDCPLPGGRSNPSCTEYDGNFILRTLDFPQNWIKVPIIILACWAVLYYVLAAMFYQFLPVDINVTTNRGKDDPETTANMEDFGTRQDRPENHRVDVALDNYKLNLKKPGFFGKGKMDLMILKGVSTRFEAGKLNVIMGPSGSGKSSLLNLMARRLRSSLTTKYASSGKMLLNNSEATDEVIRSLCSYVTQDDDALLPSLTVRETLRFAAALRLPKHMSKAAKNARAEEVLLKLGLKECADVLIGSEFKKGISGGQKRRVTIAIQILTEPVILLLDEPTSGLDSFTASSILGVLRGLADEGRTIVCTIHQSRSDLFQHFGNVLLLARGGHTVYSGAANKMIHYFSDIGYECPPTTNPADFALDVITIDLQHAKREQASRKKVERLINRFSHSEALTATVDGKSTNPSTDNGNTITLPAELGAMTRAPASFISAYPILLRRNLLNLRRQPSLLLARVGQILGLGAILTLWFAPLGNDYYSVQNRMGFAQQILPLYFVGMLQNIALYPQERDVFYAEHDDRAYGVTAFFMTYLTLEAPVELITSLIFSCLTSLAANLPRTAKMFFIMTANAFFITSCGESIGIIFNTLTTHSGFSVNAMSTIISIFTIMGGIMSTDMPDVLKAINYISPAKYGAENLVAFSLEGVEFYCTEKQLLEDGTCPVKNAQDAMRLYRMEGVSGWKNMVALVAVAIIYRLIAFVVLKARRSHWRIGGRKDAVGKVEGGKNEDISSRLGNGRDISGNGEREESEKSGVKM
ncbi:hypothetical protein EX30DRAFT_89937 [Ascodesmis nigricans]|uniref:ABC transporter domain-containing protein n=1 Tax=Ascodesmis nigricans TaxID=341454 RepID=A0A4S2N430_9PEZI|nr:hypothetical protein EX30DRAFT_89937 [Ascodesmis nigricans]